MNTRLYIGAGLVAGLVTAIAITAANADIVRGTGGSGDMVASDYMKIVAASHPASLSTKPLAVPKAAGIAHAAWCDSLRGAGGSGDLVASDYSRCH